ncbi:MAG: hypothetical protein NUW24_15235 [Anaerolineae bacterium]|jgi:hypothetical protein|nr:hypothetical protein [Anaerolineae bacterium]MDH7472602.1 hypothetical protein [Anaerolineae bacterium]
MASKRASVKGKGMDILFGGVPSEVALPGAGVVSPVQPAPGGGALTPEMESLLDEEAIAGGPSPVAVEEAIAGPVVVPSKKELAYIPPKTERPAEPVIPEWAARRPSGEEGVAAPPAPVAVEEPPPPPSVVPPLAPVVAEAAVPPPKEKPEAEAYDLKIRGLLYDAMSMAREKWAEETPGPGAGEPKEAPPPEVGPEEQPSPLRTQEEVLKAIGLKRLEALEREIDTLFSRVPKELSTDSNVNIALALLRDAQDIVQERPRQYDLAMFKVAQVKMMLERRQRIAQETSSHAYPLMIYEIGWFIVLLAGVIFSQPLSSWLLVVTGMTFADFSVNLQPMLITLIWGGIGGVVGGLWSLWKHVARDQDFDKQHTMWYLTQPIMGIILGGVIHLLFMAGVLIVESGTTTTTTAVRWFPALVACLAGFRQNFAYEWLDSVARAIGREPQPREEAAVPAAPAVSATTTSGEAVGTGT